MKIMTFTNHFSQKMITQLHQYLKVNLSTYKNKCILAETKVKEETLKKEPDLQPGDEPDQESAIKSYLSAGQIIFISEF